MVYMAHVDHSARHALSSPNHLKSLPNNEVPSRPIVYRIPKMFIR